MNTIMSCICKDKCNFIDPILCLLARCCNEEGLLWVWGEYTWLRVIGANVGCVSVGRRDRAMWATKSGDIYRLPLVISLI